VVAYHYVVLAQDGLKLVVFLPQHPECWDYRKEPTCVAIFSVVLLN
jgi:hypothetical protein